MTLRIIDKSLNEQIFNNFNKDYFTFTFSKIDNASPGNSLLTFSNFKDISIEEKINLYNLFNNLQNQELTTIIIENSTSEEELSRKIFDNSMYELEFAGLEYHTEYFTNPITTQSYEKVFFTFYFFKE